MIQRTGLIATIAGLALSIVDSIANLPPGRSWAGATTVPTPLSDSAETR